MMHIKASSPRLSGRSKLLLILTAIGLAYDLWNQQQLSILIGFFIILILVFSYFMASQNFKALSLQRKLPERLYARENFITELEVVNLKKNSNSYAIAIEDEILGNGRFSNANAKGEPHSEHKFALLLDEAPAQEACQIKSNTSLRKRGIYNSFQCHLSSSFPFGLFYREAQVELRREVVVYPAPVLPPQLEQLLSSGQGSGSGQTWRDTQGNFKGMREFSHGDSIKRVHWPLSARYQQLVVKEFEAAAANEVTIIFHSFQPKSQLQMSSPEYTLSILAGMFIHLHQSGIKINFYASFNNWQVLQISDCPDALEEALENLARAKITAHRSLSDLRQILKRQHAEMNQAIVISNTPRKLWRHLLDSELELICLDNKLKIHTASTNHQQAALME